MVCTEDEDVASRVEAITAGELAYAVRGPLALGGVPVDGLSRARKGARLT